MWSSFLEYGYWKLARAESDRPQPLREERERESENVPEHDVGCFKKNAWELYGVLRQPSFRNHPYGVISGLCATALPASKYSQLINVDRQILSKTYQAISAKHVKNTHL